MSTDLNSPNRASRPTFGRKVRKFFEEYVIIYGIVALIVFVSFGSGIILGDWTIFLSVDNFMNVLRQVSMIAIISAGMFFVLVSGGVDISVGATAGLINVLFAGFLVWYGMPWPLSALLCLVISAVIGVVNGTLVAVFGIPPLIATLGTQSILRGLIFVITNAYAVFNLPTNIRFLGNGYVLSYIPIPVIIMVVIFIIINFISQRTKFGRSAYAVGGNIEAAYLSGINQKRVRILCYMIVNICAGVSAIILTSRLASGQPNSGTGWEFEAIIATVIGGVSIIGGKGRAFGAMFGALLIGIFTNGMTLMNVNSYYQQMIKGLILISAIGLDVYSAHRRARAV